MFYVPHVFGAHQGIGVLFEKSCHVLVLHHWEVAGEGLDVY